MLKKKADALYEDSKGTMSENLEVAMQVLLLYCTCKDLFVRMQDMGLKELLDVDDYTTLEHLYKNKRTLENLGRNGKTNAVSGTATNDEALVDSG